MFTSGVHGVHVKDVVRMENKLLYVLYHNMNRVVEHVLNQVGKELVTLESRCIIV